jgi:hypothetical protein
MTNDAESIDPLEQLLADWYASAMLAAEPRPAPDSETAYAAQLELIATTRARARALARTQCIRLFARLERRFSSPGWRGPAAASETASGGARRLPANPVPRTQPSLGRVSFELSI